MFSNVKLGETLIKSKYGSIHPKGARTSARHFPFAPITSDLAAVLCSLVEWLVVLPSAAHSAVYRGMRTGNTHHDLISVSLGRFPELFALICSTVECPANDEQEI